MFYLLNYEVTNSDTLNTLVKVKWILPKFSAILDSPTNHDVCTNKKEIPVFIEKSNMLPIKFKEEYKFRLRMKICRSYHEPIQVYYLAPRPVYLKCELIMVPTSKNRIIASHDFQAVESNKWQLLGNYTTNFLSDCRILRFNFFIRHDKCTSEKNTFGKTYNMQRDKMAKVQLKCDLQNLLNGHMFSDAIIKSNEGVEMHAHRGMLAARSPVFQAHFAHNKDENMITAVECPFKAEVLQAMLEYIYTANSEKLNEMPEELLRAADYYQLEELKNICEQTLCGQLTVENVISTLELANLYTALNLESSCFEFINVNSISVIQTKEWKDMKSLELCKRIVEYNISNK